MEDQGVEENETRPRGERGVSFVFLLEISSHGYLHFFMEYLLKYLLGFWRRFNIQSSCEQSPGVIGSLSSMNVLVVPGRAHCHIHHTT